MDTKKRWMIARGRGWGMGKMGAGGQKAQTSSYKSHKDVMDSIATIGNNTVLLVWELLINHHKKKVL